MPGAKIATFLAAVVGTCVAFLLALASAVWLHINVPAARRVATASINRALADVFRGRIEIERIGGVHLWPLSDAEAGGVSARLLGPSGEELARMDHVHAHCDLVALWRSLRGAGDLQVVVRDGYVQHANVRLDTDADGTLLLVKALTPRSSSPDASAGEESTSKGAHVRLENIRLGHGWGRGTIGSVPPIDGEVDDARTDIEIARTVTVRVSAPHAVWRAPWRGLTAEGEAEFSLESQDLLTMNASWRGEVGGIPARAWGHLQDRRVEVALDVPRAVHARVRDLVPEIPLAEDFRLHAEARGTFPRLAIDALAVGGRARIAAEGELTMAPEIGLHARARAVDVDARAFSGPSTRVSADVTADVRFPCGCSYDVSLLPSVVAGTRLPSARVRGHVDTKGAHPIVAFRLATEETALRPWAEGNGKLEAEGTFGDGHIDAEFVAAAQNVAKAGADAGTLTVRGIVRGDVRRPFVDAQIAARALSYGEERFSRGIVHLRGPLTSPVVETILYGEGDTPRVEAAARLSLGDEATGLTLADAHAAIVRKGATLMARASEVHIRGGSIVVEEAELAGVGESPAYVSVRREPRRLRLRFHGNGLDAARVAEVMGLREDIRGKVDADVDLLFLPDGAYGTVSAIGTDLALDDITSGSLALDASVDGRHVRVGVHGKLGDVGHVDVNTAALTLSGSPLSLAAWRRVTGHVQVDTYVEAAHLARFLPSNAPVRVAQGLVMLEVDIARTDGDALPSADVSLLGKDLTVTGPRLEERDLRGDVLIGRAEWWGGRLNVKLDAHVDGGTGHTRVDGSLSDRNAPVFTLHGEGALPYLDLVRDPEHSAERLMNTDLTLFAAVPRRRIDNLPPVLHTRGLGGEAELRVDVRGKLRDPEIHLEGHTYEIKRRTSPRPPSSMDVLAHYRAGEGLAEVHVRQRQTEVLRGRIVSHGDIFHGEGWEASAEAQATSFPLDALTLFSDRQVRGRLSGEVSVNHYHRDARATARLTLADLRVGRTHYRDGLISLDVGPETTRAVVRLDRKDGYAEAHATWGTSWGADWLPSVDEGREVTGELHAKSFRAGAIAPFLQPHVSELDGRIDADATFRLPAAANARDPRRPHMEGTLVLRRGSIELPLLGERIRHAQAKIRIDDEGLVRVDDLAGEAAEGRFYGSGALRLSGLSVVGASGSVRIPRTAPVPFMVGGEPLAKAYGDATMRATVQGGTTVMNVDVPTATVRLPDESSHHVIELEPPDRIRVGVRRAGNVVRLVSLGPAVAREEEDAAGKDVVMAVRIGNQVDLRRGTDLRVLLEGTPKVIFGPGETRVEGQIAVVGGFIEVQGRRFTLEKGTITFAGDPKNPTANITASYLAPEGTQIFADFIGPMQTGKVTLRSQPARSQEEILALILYGTDLGASAPSRQTSMAAGAVGTGGGLASRGINKAIEGLTGSDFATVRVDTTEQANPRPEVEFQIARNITLELATVFGRLPMDQPDRNFLTLDWRFRRSWSVSSTVGDRGSTLLDIVWQRRY